MASIKYNNLEYSIDNLEYPIGLSDLNGEYSGHRVLFMINVVSESKFRKSPGGEPDVYDIPAGELKKNAGQRRTAEISSLLNTTEAAINSKLNSSISLAPSPVTKRLKAAISLHMPTDLMFTYGTQWGEEDLATSENFADFAGDAMNGNVVGGGADFIGRKMLDAARRNPAIANAMRQTPGNAKAAQLFQGVDFRTFNFTYDFAPRSAVEAKNCLGIIRMFKHHMLPEYKDNDQFLYIYPSEFDIKYFYKTEENENLDKHFTAVCTNCSINYAPNGQFSTFKGTGIPTQMRMTLTFKELSVSTKESTPLTPEDMQNSEISKSGADIRNRK